MFHQEVSLSCFKFMEPRDPAIIGVSKETKIELHLESKRFEFPYHGAAWSPAPTVIGLEFFMPISIPGIEKIQEDI